MCNYLQKFLKNIFKSLLCQQNLGYDDCIPSIKKSCSVYNTKLHLWVRSNSGELGASLYCKYCYATICLSGLQGVVRSRQVHQLTKALTLAVVCRTLFSVIDITNSQAEQHFKATRRVIGEILRVNTSNWQDFSLKYKVFDNYNSSTTKRIMNCRVWVNKINNNILLLNKRKKQRKNKSGKSQEREIFQYLGGAATKISVSRTKPT